MRCSDLASALLFYVDELGFRIDVIFPADAPREARLSGHGLLVRLEQDKNSSHSDDREWGTGRAGMQYRDLIPGRLDGRLIASHIRIPNGGPVPDYVHHHDVIFQMIYCYRGWVKVVYEDQGPAFVMHSGDCVLQPPHIRHRVLECSDQMEVIEVSSPAEHETFADHELELPTGTIDTQREFNGQQFLRHQAKSAKWCPGPYKGFTVRDTGIAEATNGLASVEVMKPVGPILSTPMSCAAGILFTFVLQGTVTMEREQQLLSTLETGDSFVISAGMQTTIVACTNDLELLQVALE